MLTSLSTRRIFYPWRSLSVIVRSTYRRTVDSHNDGDEPTDSTSTSTNSTSMPLWKDGSQQIQRSAPRKFRDCDLLGEAIFKAKDWEHLKDVINLHVTVMSHKHLGICFSRIRKFVDESASIKNTVTSSEEFAKICSRTVSKLRFFGPRELLDALRCLVNLGVKESAQVNVATKQMIRGYLNDFSISELITLHFLLHKSRKDGQTSSALEEALAIAIPLVIDVKVASKEFDDEGVEYLSKILDVISKNQPGSNPDNSNRIVSILQKKKGEITLRAAVNIISSLTKRCVSTNPKINLDEAEDLMNYCSDLVSNASTSSKQRYIPLLVTGLSKGHYYYHKGLYRTIGDWLLENQETLPLVDYYNVLSVFAKNNHVRIKLLDCFYDMLLRHRNDLMRKYVNINNILSAYSLLPDYNPSFSMDSFLELILNERKINQLKNKNFESSLIYLLKNLTVLNRIVEDVFKNVIRDNLSSVMTQPHEHIDHQIHLQKALLLIYSGLTSAEATKSTFSDVLPIMEPFVNEAKEAVSKHYTESKSCLDLKPYAELALGGQGFVLHSTWTSTGVFVPHFLIMRKGDYAMSLNKYASMEFVDQIDAPFESKKVVIVPYTAEDYCREPYVLKGSRVHQLNLLKSLGITPISVDLDGWNTLSTREKVPRIMKLIQDACKEEVLYETMTSKSE